MAYTPTLWAKGDKVTSEKLNKIEQGIVDKVDKETGKTLSTNDFTDAYKTKLDGIEANADKTIIDATLTNSGAAADAKATGDAIQNIENDLDGKVDIIESNLDEKVENLKSLVGTPLKATTASAMTDTSKIYVYTGNESGYTNGDWYYHDGSAWVDGGTYNSVAVEVDKTLTVDGMPADAKVVGDEIGSIKEDFKEFSGYTNYALTEGKYYATNGQTVNIDAPSNNNGWKTCVIECAEGDSFYVTGQSGSSPRLWCFVDASNSRTSASVLSVSIPSKTESNTVITAPANSTHLVCNFVATQPAKLTHGQTIAEITAGIKSDIDGLTTETEETKQGLTGIKQTVTDITDSNLDFVETATAGTTNAYKQIANKLKVGTQYAFKVTSRTKGTYLFQAGIGQSASSMYDIGTYSIDAGETKTIIGYTTTNQNIKYFRLYSANVPLANMDWDVSIYTYFDAKENIEDLKASTNKTFENVVNAIPIELTKGQYYNTSGATVDINAPLINNGWNSMVVDCAFTDIFTITGTGGSTPRLWVFADENGNILAKNTRATETNLEIIAPKNARYLVANFEASSPQLLLKGSSVSNRYAIEDYECRITTKQKVVVAKDSSGDYSSIQDAINSITDSSFTNQYEIVLKEGTYNEQNLILPKYTYLHGVGRNKPVITSEGLTEYVSVIDAQNTCRIANVKVVSATKYCLHEDVSLHGCTVICEDVDFEQLGTSNVTIIGNGVFENAKFIFMGCTFKGGQVFSHTNSTSYIGVTQHLVIKYCKFINAGIVLAVSGSVESNTMADCICEVVGCRGDGTTPLITCRVPSDNVYPWKIIGGSNINFSVTFDGETLTDVINTTDN